MLDQFMEIIMIQLIKRKIIAKEDQQVYLFGIKTMFIQVLHMLVVIMIGFCVDLLLESTLFLLMYIPLRVNAGGYHAPNNKWCFIITILMDIMVLIVIKYLPNERIESFVGMVFLITIPLILKYAPVENIKKPLDMLEKKIYATRTYWIAGTIIVGSLTAFLVDKANIALVLALSFLVEGIMISVSIVQNKKLLQKK